MSPLMRHDICRTCVKTFQEAAMQNLEDDSVLMRYIKIREEIPVSRFDVDTYIKELAEYMAGILQ